MMDKQQVPCIFDIFGNEIYDGNEYFVGDEGIMACPSQSENYDPNNQIIAALVEALGTEYIMEELGYEKRTFRR